MHDFQILQDTTVILPTIAPPSHSMYCWHITGKKEDKGTYTILSTYESKIIIKNPKQEETQQISTALRCKHEQPKLEQILSRKDR